MTETAQEDLELAMEEEGEWQGGTTEYRSAQISDVSYPQREIEVVVLPYEVPAVIHDGNRVFQEVVSRGAFGNVQRRSGGRIKVNLDHDPRKPVGRVQVLYPNRDEGLVAKLRVSKTQAGDETLEYANDGVLDASAAFGLLVDKNTGRVKPDAEVWETRNRRRLNHLWLEHVALVSNPAHPSANVIAVRHDTPQEPAAWVARPNRDQVRLWQLEDEYDAISRRM